MIGTRARHLAFLTLLLSACAAEGVGGEGSSASPPALGSSAQALLPGEIAVIGCGNPDSLNFGACSRKDHETPGSSEPGKEYQPVYPAQFQVVGLNPDLSAGVQQVNELAFTFKPWRIGRPGSFHFSLRRTGPAMDSLSHDLLVDVLALTADGKVPLPRTNADGCGYGILSGQMARGRYNLELVPWALPTPPDVAAQINLSSPDDIRSRMTPASAYAVYVHIESPGRDSIGLAGMVADVYFPNELGPYTRQARVYGASCLSNPAWVGRANEEVFFRMTVDDGCTVGNTRDPCGTGICARDDVPECDSYGNFIDCSASFCDRENDIRCVPVDPDGPGGIIIDPNEYGCNVAKRTCYKRVPVTKTCTTDVQCRPQAPSGVTIDPNDYKCNLATNRCITPPTGVQCYLANDPICVPSGSGVVASNYGCDVARNKCYTLFGNAVPEACNGLDDNCDGTVDNQLGTITCGTGRCERQEYACKANGQPFTCPVPDPRVNAVPEICNNIDDDCDGQVDEEMTALSCGVGVCFATGFPACFPGGVPGTCTEKPPRLGGEVCNGLDDDCDNRIDNPVTGENGVMIRERYPFAEETKNKGICRPGTEQCAGQAGVEIWNPIPSDPPVGPEVTAEFKCDGRDEDCDGEVDNVKGTTTKLTQPFYEGPAGTQNVGRCQNGVQTCGGLGFNNTPIPTGTWGTLIPWVGPVAETCNGVDDNCNGQVDEGLGTWTCGLGVCQITIDKCQGGTNRTCGPPGTPDQQLGDQSKRKMDGEDGTVCNNRDDDCDGEVDNKPGSTDKVQRACYTGPNGTLNKGECRAGTETCQTGGIWPASPANPAACVGQVLPAGREICNDKDDNCDGFIDNDNDLNLCPVPPSASYTSEMKCGYYGAQKTCVVKTCAADHYDLDGNPENGCELDDDGNAPGNTTPNNTCLQGLNMGAITLGAELIQYGKIPQNNLADYFYFTVPYANNAEKTQNVKITLTDKDSLTTTSNFKFTVLSTSCVTPNGVLYQCQGATPPPAGSLLHSWTFKDTIYDTGAPNGAGGRTRTGALPSTVLVKVTRVTGATLSGLQYKLSITRTVN